MFPVFSDKGRFVLKILMLPSPERRIRTLFLKHLELFRLLPVFAAAEYRSVAGPLQVELSPPYNRIEQVHVEGYLAPFIEGVTFADLLANPDFHMPTPQRARLAGELCAAVSVLEDSAIAHTDLGSHNIIITGVDTPTPQLRLIDFDSLYHQSIPTVAVACEGGRKFGMDGYRHQSYRAMDEGVVITSDRVSMAVLAYELVVLQPADVFILGRDTLLEQTDLDTGIAELPAEIAARWPAGWELVRRAVCAPSAHEAPSPDEWLQALRTSAPELEGSLYPPLRVLVRDQYGEILNCVGLTRQSNNFGGVQAALTFLNYERLDVSTVRLYGESPSHLFLLRADSRQPERIERGAFSITIRAGDALRVQLFDLEFT